MLLLPEEVDLVEKYYRQEYEDMLKFARYTLQDESLAEVAVQDTFTIASMKIKKLIGSPNPEGWLYNVLKNVIRQLRRERQKCLERCVALDLVQEPAAEMPPVSTLEPNKNDDLQLMARLYVYGYSLEEIAAELEISVPALKMRLSRMRKRLQKDPEIKNLKMFAE